MWLVESGLVESGEWLVEGSGSREAPYDLLHFLNDCAEINKMLNVPIQKLSTIHYSLFT